MDRGAWQATVHGVARVRYDLATKPPPSCFCCVRFCATLWIVAHQAPLSMRFSRQEYWSGLPCSPPGDLPDPGIEPVSLMSPTLAGEFFTTWATWEVQWGIWLVTKC